MLLRHADWPASVSQDELGSIYYIWALIVEPLKQYAETGKPNPSLPSRPANARARQGSGEGDPALAAGHPGSPRGHPVP